MKRIFEILLCFIMVSCASKYGLDSNTLLTRKIEYKELCSKNTCELSVYNPDEGINNLRNFTFKNYVLATKNGFDKEFIDGKIKNFLEENRDRPIVEYLKLRKKYDKQLCTREGLHDFFKNKKPINNCLFGLKDIYVFQQIEKGTLITIGSTKADYLYYLAYNEKDANAVDGAKLDNGLFIMSGTKTYTTALNTTKTLYSFKRVCRANECYE